MDYFHYRYHCPYITSTDAKTIYCEGKNRLCFETVAECRKWLLRFCADCNGWKHCQIAQRKLKYQQWKEEHKIKKK